MDARYSQEQVGLFPHTSSDRIAHEVEVLRHAAIRARDEAAAATIRGILARIGGAIAGFATAVASWPERRRTYADLRGLSDRELADIGLNRGDIGRVFEEGFGAAPSPARSAVVTAFPARKAPVANTNHAEAARSAA